MPEGGIHSLKSTAQRFGFLPLVCPVALICCACGGDPSVQELEVPSSDVTLFVRVAGSPEGGGVLIATNGGPGLSSHDVISLEQLAGDTLAVVTCDQRGIGRSSKPVDEAANYCLPMAEATRDALSAAQVEFVVLPNCGHFWQECPDEFFAYMRALLGLRSTAAAPVSDRP